MTAPIPHKQNGVMINRIGFCVNCDRDVELTREATCCLCLSNSIFFRRPAQLVKNEFEKLEEKIRTKGL